jgi:hypothetical protein
MQGLNGFPASGAPRPWWRKDDTKRYLNCCAAVSKSGLRGRSGNIAPCFETRGPSAGMPRSSASPLN